MAASWDLQVLVVDRLKAAVPALGGRVYDRAPENVTWPYATMGPSDYRREDAACIDARVETLQVDVWSRHAPGRREAKDLTDAIADALHGFDDTMGNATILRVTMARVMSDPDPLVSHGVVSVEAAIETYTAP